MARNSWGSYCALQILLVVVQEATSWVSLPAPTPLLFRLGVLEAASSSPSSSSVETVSTQTLGTIWNIEIPGQDSSFVGAMGVPTFAADGERRVSLVDNDSTTAALGLEGALDGLGPSLVVQNVLDPSACDTLINELEGFGFGSFQQGKNHHGALQVVVSSDLAHSVAVKLSPHIDVGKVEALRTAMLEATHTPDTHTDVRLGFVGLNRRWRIYRYDNSGNETFAPHIDAGFPPSGLSEDGRYLEWDTSDPQGDEIVSRLTVLMYLNENFEGGETNFYRPIADCRDTGAHADAPLVASVRPRTGSVLLFPQGVGDAAVEYARRHWPLHEGSPVLAGSNRPKYVIRSDALFVTQRLAAQYDVNEDFDGAHLSQYDVPVRQAFLPKSDALCPIFLNHVASLYNPHMGVENLGAFLYSFIRLTKRRHVMEIGAGYTSLWILQALKDNDRERERIRDLEQRGECRLLDIEWTVPVNEHDIPSSLLCIDNCLHQKETATGALAVARVLGLKQYLSFQKDDAFEELSRLQPSSVDILWCDFGVGSRILDFVAEGAWESIRPGGFLLCHSTLTNANTRNWLEKVRARAPKEETGLDPGSYAELSLLEPHKRFQNSITILQKRSGYSEPVHSQYA